MCPCRPVLLFLRLLRFLPQSRPCGPRPLAALEARLSCLEPAPLLAADCHNRDHVDVAETGKPGVRQPMISSPGHGLGCRSFESGRHSVRAARGRESSTNEPPVPVFWGTQHCSTTADLARSLRYFVERSRRLVLDSKQLPCTRHTIQFAFSADPEFNPRACD